MLFVYKTLYLEYCKNEVHAGRSEEQKSCLAAFALIQVKSLLVSFFPWGVSACMSFTSEFCLACWVLCYRFALNNHVVIMTITMIMMVIIIKYFFIPFKGKVSATHG